MHFWLRNNLDSGAFRGARRSGTASRAAVHGRQLDRCAVLRGNTEASCAPPPRTRSCASIPIACDPSIPRRAGAISSASSTTGFKGIENGVMDEPRSGLRSAGPRRDRGGATKQNGRSRARADQIPFRPVAAARRQDRIPARSLRPNPAATGSTHLSGIEPRLDGLDLGASRSDDKPGMGVWIETPPLPEDVEVTGPVAANLGRELDEDMDLFLRSATSTRTATSAGDRPAEARRCRWRKAGSGRRTASSTPN